MAERRYREGVDHVPGHLAAAKLLNKHGGSHVGAWNSLEIFDFEAAKEYMEDQSAAAIGISLKGVPKGRDVERMDKIFEVASLFALTAVMADRERREQE